jgi:adenine C2-methylase RlmN of 23S rRNA A2503 and tRNA A37
MEHLYGKTLAELRVIAEEFGLPRFAAGQIARWLYKRHVNDIAAMTDLSAVARQRLAERYDVGLTAPLAVSFTVMEVGRLPSWLLLSTQVLVPEMSTVSISWVLVMV